MNYRYFQHPHKFSTYTNEKQHCDLCKQVRPGYKRPFYGRRRIKFVCEECLAGGRLADVRATTNEGDVVSLRSQLEEMRPNSPDSPQDDSTAYLGTDSTS